MNRREVLTGGTAITMANAIAPPIKLDVAKSGAVGDGIADDAPAIQAALNHVGSSGGGVAFLSPPKVNYRVATGLKLPSNVILEGPAPVRYPFNAGNKGACALVADFTDTEQWVVEPTTRVNGRSIPFNQLLTGSLFDGITYNCGVRNLLITSNGRIPYGGIRMHGCPGSIVDGVSIDRVGCGLLVNYSFGGAYNAQVHPLYYGVAAWDDANANLFQIYCTHSTPWPKAVPEAYRLPFMAQMSGHFADTLKLANDDHASRPYGLLCGSIRSTSVGNAFDVVIERFPGGIFLFNAYATDFRRCYLEADPATMACAIAASRSRFSMQALHAYLSGTGAIFDFGINVLGKVYGSGVLHAATFGKPPFDDGSSLLLLEGIDPAIPGAPIQRGIRYASRETDWLPLALRSGWRIAGGDYDSPSVRFNLWSHQVELKGTIAGGAKGVCFTLPQHCRPAMRRRMLVAGGQIEVGPDGVVQIAPDGDLVGLDGVSFARW